MKRTVAWLLVRLEHMPPSTAVVAATNQPSMLDRATRRRFQIRLELEGPDMTKLAEHLESRRRRAPSLRLDPAAAADTLDGTSYAEAAEFCDDLERQQLLHPGQDAADLFERRLARWVAGRRKHPQRTPLELAEGA